MSTQLELIPKTNVIMDLYPAFKTLLRVFQINTLLIAALLHATIIFGFASDQAHAQDRDRSAVILEKNDIEPTLAGITSYLKTLDPASPLRVTRHERALVLVGQLGNANFQIRERAQQSLAVMPELPEAELRKAVASADPETAWRAKSLLNYVATRDRTFTDAGITEAVANVIQDQEIKGATSILLETIPRFEEKRTLTALTLALASTVEKDDTDQLKRAMDSGNVEVCAASVVAYDKLLGADANGKLIALLEDSEPRIRLIAAGRLADRGNRRTMPVLIELLKVDELEHRLDSVRILRALTGKRFDFMAYGSAERRAKAVASWSDWLEREGKTAKLMFPLVLRPHELGRILITDYGRNRVTEVDMKGNEVWTAKVQTPWGCQGLPNGHRVIASYAGKFIVEFDAAGNEVWRQDNLPGNGMGIHRLENGNTLVACSASNKIVEYTMDNKVAWEATIKGRPVDVERLGNGRTLIALEANDGQKIVEVDRDGKIVWEIANINKPLTVQRIENGNSLVATSSSTLAIEFDREGNRVWEYDLKIKSTVARRLNNGDTIVAAHKFLRLLAPDGNIRWEINDFKYCYGARPY